MAWFQNGRICFFIEKKFMTLNENITFYKSYSSKNILHLVIVGLFDGKNHLTIFQKYQIKNISIN